jgi:hypothetical protein
MHYALNAPVPQHIYGYVEKRILFGLEDVEGYEPCVITGVTSIPGRAIHFSILCESGAQWARIPIHCVFHKLPCDDEKPAYEVFDLQMWDCMGLEFSVVQYTYFREMSCTFRNREGKNVPAQYWFTLDHTDNGFSLSPTQHKCFHILKCFDGSGQIAAMPNNRIVWHDPSFVKLGAIPQYKVMADVTWHAEQQDLDNPHDTAFTE